MTFVDFAALKERVKIEQVVPLCGIDIKWKGAQGRASCPACKGNDRTLAVNIEKSSFYCFAAKTGGDMIAMAAHTRGVSQRDAAEDISKRLDSSSHSAPPIPSPAKEPAKDDMYLDALRDQIEELEARVAILEDNKIVKLRAP